MVSVKKKESQVSLLTGICRLSFFIPVIWMVLQHEVQNDLWKDIRASGMRACELCFIPVRFSCIINMEKQIEYISDENGGMNIEADDDRNLEDGI